MAVLKRQVPKPDDRTPEEIAQDEREEQVFMVASDMLTAASNAAQKIYDREAKKLKLKDNEIDMVMDEVRELLRETGLDIAWYLFEKKARKL